MFRYKAEHGEVRGYKEKYSGCAFYTYDIMYCGRRWSVDEDDIDDLIKVLQELKEANGDNSA